MSVHFFSSSFCHCGGIICRKSSYLSLIFTSISTYNSILSILSSIILLRFSLCSHYFSSAMYWSIGFQSISCTSLISFRIFPFIGIALASIVNDIAARGTKNRWGKFHWLMEEWFFVTNNCQRTFKQIDHRVSRNLSGVNWSVLRH